MWRSMVFFLIVLCSICKHSSQSPQSSFFGWPSSEAEVLKTNSQTRLSNTSGPEKDVTQSSQLSVESQLGSEMVPSKSQILKNLQENVNSTAFNTSEFLQKDSLTPGLTNYLSDELSSFLSTGVVFLGAALGRGGCDLKAACLAGTFVPQIQGRDIAVVAAEPLVPEVWKNFYEAAKSSIIQGQDCSQFDCA